MNKSITIFSLALIASATLSCCLAKDVSSQQIQQPSLHQPPTTARQSLASKLIPKARTARSLSDMFEKMKSKIFGNKKGQASSSLASSQSQQSAVQSMAPVNSAQRQPWGDLSSFNQQYNPYSPLGASASNYQWPAGSSMAGQQSFSGQPAAFNSAASMNSFMSSPMQSNYPTMTAGSAMMPGMMDSSASQLQGSQSAPSATGSSSGGSQGGLLSSASQLIAQYLSPGSSSASGSPASPQGSSSPGASQAAGGAAVQNGGSAQASSILSPQQQSQYNEFASILDSMVAQTGVGNSQQQQQQQRQSNMNNQFINGQLQPNYQNTGMMPGAVASSPNGDQDMSGSSNVQSYLPSATPQQASQKSSMVSLAEQLAPGAQFNKLVSFPFSLSNNDDPNKEGRYKLHIPFLNQHVKRSDQQQVAANSYAAAQQRMYQQQYLSNNYNQAYMNAQQQQQQQPAGSMTAQASQLAPTVVSPAGASPVASSQAASSSASLVPSASASATAPVSATSAIAPASSQSAMSSVSAPKSQSSSSSLISSPSQQSSVSVSSSVASQSSNSRPNWSVADTSSKLIPIQSSSQSAQSDTSAQN